MRRDSQLIIDVSLQRIQELEEQSKNPELYAPVSTGMRELDALIGGIPRYDAFIGVILAIKKLGKTTLAMHLAHQFALATKEPVMYFGLEELRYQFADRLMSNLADVTRRKMFMRSLSEDDIYHMDMSIYKMSPHLWVQDTIFTLDEAAKEMKRRKCRLGIWDNIQLTSRTQYKGGSDREKLEAIGRRIVELRNDEKLSFIVVSQESSDSRAFGSDEILRGMDFGLRINPVYEEIENDKGKKIKGEEIEYEREIEVLRSRQIGTGKVIVAFDGAHNRIGRPVSVPFDHERFQALVDGKQVIG